MAQVTIGQALELAAAWREAGRTHDATALLTELLTAHPHRHDALFLLALCRHDLGDLAASCKLLEQACALAPQQGKYWHNLAMLLQALGRGEESHVPFREALRVHPEGVATRYQFAVALQQSARREEAIEQLRIVVASEPQHPTALVHLVSLLVDTNQLAAAAPLLPAALSQGPHAWAYITYGDWLHKHRRDVEAFTAYNRATECDAQLPEARLALANFLLGQSRYAEAADVCRAAHEAGLKHAALYNAWALALLPEAGPAAAVEPLRRAIALAPQRADYHGNLAQMLIQQERYSEALTALRTAESLAGDCLYLGLEALHVRQIICDWHGLSEEATAWLARWRNASAAATDRQLSPFAFLALPVATTPEEQKRCAARQRLAVHSAAAQPPLPIAPRETSRSGRIVVGYLSSDLHEHATAYLLAGMLECHDQEAFEIRAYSYGPNETSLMRTRLQRSVAAFVDVRGISDHAAAARIAADGVEILVDLKGHTQHARLGILDFRPAPVQVHYLGYPGTTGSPAVDYFLADAFVLPPLQHAAFTERIVTLPGCYQVNDRQRMAATSTPTRRDCGLPEQALVLCSFNNNYKITPEVFNIWMHLLRTVPESVLWLLAGNRTAVANLQKAAAAQQVAPERLIFAPFCSLGEHLARYRLADLFLDTFPVNAHTTASDALWMGCPLLTCCGETFASRVAGSLLQAVGLPELIAPSLEAYRTLATSLAADRPRLRALRQKLEHERDDCRLFDTVRFTRSLERAYRQMWERARRGEPPQSFCVDDV
jgi:predicted O-linked N-acetylglucosamine transferase (SPINDLY family)